MRLFENVTTFESLKIPDFRLLWLGQLTTSTAQWMDNTARSWLIYTMTGSPLQLGIIGAAKGIPILLFGILAGVAADRYGRKPQLVIAQSVNAVIDITLATLVITGRVEVWHVYVTTFLSGTVQAFQQPARQALINDLVGGKNLLNAISLNSAAHNVSRSVGPAIAGLLIYALGVGTSYYIMGATFVLATIWTFQIKVPQAHESLKKLEDSTEISIFESIKEGFNYVASKRLLLALIIMGLAPVVLAMPYNSLMPIFAIDVFHGDSRTQGLLLTMSGIGAVAGALTLASLGQKQGSGKLLIMAAASYGLCLVLFSQSPVLLMAYMFILMAGISNGFYTSQNQTFIQTLTPDKLRGRVLGIYYLNRGLTPLGSLMAGALASALGAPSAVTLMGFSCFLLIAGIAVLVPDIRKLKIIPDE